MNFSLSEEQQMVRKAARDFAQTELKPGVIKRDELQEFPDNLVKKNGSIGLYGYYGRPQVRRKRHGYDILCFNYGRTI